MDLTQKNFNELFIAKDVNVTGTSMDGMAVGEVAMFTPSGKRLTAGATTGNVVKADTIEKAKFVKKIADKEFQVSDVIDKNFVTSIAASEYAAKQEQVTYIGFNGSGGSLDIINNNLYTVRFVFSSFLVSNHGGDYYKTIPWKSAVSGTTQAKIASGLVKAASRSFGNEDKFVKVEVVGETTKDITISPTATTLVFTHNSPVISATAVTGLAVGDLLRVGTTATDPLYKIIAVDSVANTATLEIPFKGASTSLGNAAVAIIPKADVDDIDYGLKATGLPMTSSLGKFLPSVVNFQVSLNSSQWQDTEVTYATGAFVGSDTAEIIAAEEFIMKGNQGDFYRYGRDSFQPTYAAEAIAYNSVFVQFRDETEVGSPKPVSLKQVKVAIPDGAANDVWSKATTGLQAVVNMFFGTTISMV